MARKCWAGHWSCESSRLAPRVELSVPQEDLPLAVVSPPQKARLAERVGYFGRVGCLLVVLLVGCESKPPTVYRLAAPQEMLWGEPHEGLQAGLRIEGYVAEPEPALRMTLAIRNVGDEPFRVHRVAANAAFFLEPLVMTSRKYLKKYKGPNPGAAVVRADEFIELRPGGVDEHSLVMPLSHYGLEPPLPAETAYRYRWLGAREMVRDVETGEVQTIDGIWFGDIRSGVVEWELKP